MLFFLCSAGSLSIWRDACRGVLQKAFRGPASRFAVGPYMATSCSRTVPRPIGAEVTVRGQVTGCGHPLRRKLVTVPQSPTSCSSQTQTAHTTTMFKMVLMLEAMGIYRLTRYNATPTTINMTTRFSKGIFLVLLESGKSNCLPDPLGPGKRALKSSINCHGQKRIRAWFSIRVYRCLSVAVNSSG